MSGILGSLHLDGSSPSQTACERMLALSIHRGPDDCGLWVRGPLALGHAQFRTTPENDSERQPLEDPSRQFVLVFDGRVDNRHELRKKAVALGASLRNHSDAELVLHLCMLTGPSAPEQIVGDFALAFWDARTRTLLCARDPLGIRPFYYRRDANNFSFASELPALLSTVGTSLEPNEGMVAEYLACNITSQSETLYRDIYRLPPGHLMLLVGSRVNLHRYWLPDPRRTIRYQDDRAYGEHFRAIFEEAVRCRLQSSTCVGIDLSGGLDSSTVACTAHQFARREGSVELETLSLIFPRMSCDEQLYIQEVVRAFGMQNFAAKHATPTLDECAQWSRKFRDFPGHPNGLMFEPLWSHANKQGMRVCLSGMGGDDWFQGAPAAMQQADHLRHGAFASFLRTMSHQPGSALAALKHVLRPHMPKSVLSFLRSRRKTANVPEWLDQGFVRRTNLEERLRTPLLLANDHDYAWDYHYMTGTGGWQTHALECEERCGAWNSIEYRYPFLDRRLIEFALALPENQRRRDGVGKIVLRDGMRGILPESIRTRTDKAVFDLPMLDTLTNIYGEFDRLGTHATAYDWVRLPGVVTALEKAMAPNQPVDTGSVWPLWMLFGIECWLAHGLHHAKIKPSFSTALVLDDQRQLKL